MTAKLIDDCFVLDKDRLPHSEALAIRERIGVLGENHVIRALDEELVFVGFLQGVPGTRPGKVGGKMARQRK